MRDFNMANLKITKQHLKDDLPCYESEIYIVVDAG